MTEPIIKTTVGIYVKLERCYTCGRWYGVETNLLLHHSKRCPGCAGKKLSKLEAQVEKLQRSVAAYKRAAKRRRRR